MTISFLSYEWRNFQEANSAVDWIPMIADFSLMNGGKYIQRRLDWRDISRLAIYIARRVPDRASAQDQFFFL